MSTEENKTLYRHLMEDVISQGNIGASDELMTPDIIEHEAGPAQERGSVKNYSETYSIARQYQAKIPRPMLVHTGAGY